MPTLHSHTHCQATRANAKAKACQRVCLSQRTADRNDTANFKEKNKDVNERQCTTNGIKHWGLSGYSSVLHRIKFGVTGQESSPQSPTISYRRPLAPISACRASGYVILIALYKTQL